MAIYETLSTGVGPINVAHTATATARQVLAVLMHLDAGPSSSASLYIKFVSHAGTEYKTTLYSLDLSTAGNTDIYWYPAAPLYINPGDGISVEYSNPDARTIGVTIMTAGS